MIKKINFILVLLLLLVSIGAVSAADDLNDTIASDDGAILEEVIQDDVLASDNFEDKYSSDSNSYTVNESNYDTYFDSKGEATSSVKTGDTINLDGAFNNKNFTFNTPVNLIGSESNNLKNCVITFCSGASGSNITGLKIANNVDYYYGIFLNILYLQT